MALTDASGETRAQALRIAEALTVRSPVSYYAGMDVNPRTHDAHASMKQYFKAVERCVIHCSWVQRFVSK